MQACGSLSLKKESLGKEKKKGKKGKKKGKKEGALGKKRLLRKRLQRACGPGSIPGGGKCYRAKRDSIRHIVVFPRLLQQQKAFQSRRGHSTG